MTVNEPMANQLLERALSFYRPPRSRAEVYQAGGERPPGWDEAHHDEIKVVAGKFLRVNPMPRRASFIDGLKALQSMPQVNQGVFGNRYDVAKMGDFIIAISSMPKRRAEGLIERLFVGTDRDNIAERVTQVEDMTNDQLRALFDDGSRAVSYVHPGLVLAYAYPERYPRVRAEMIRRLAKLVGVRIERGDDGRQGMYEFAYTLVDVWRRHIRIRDYIDAFVLMHILTDKDGLNLGR